jgi:DNA polymerase-4
MSLVRARVQTVEVIGLDEAYLDLTGMPAPDAAMRQLAASIFERTGLHCSIGIGPSKLVAKVASDAEKPRGFVVLSRMEACSRFAGAPCGLVPGIGPKTVERLRALGISTLGELAAADAGLLGARFGRRMAAELIRRASFEDDSPVTQERKVVSESRETTFDRDIASISELEAVMSRLVGRLASDLAAKDRCGRTVGIKIRLNDFSTHTRARTLARPVGTEEEIGPVALDLLRRFGVPAPVRLLGVRLAGLSAAQATAEQQLTLSL